MKDTSLPDYHRSIFHQLFEHASDQDCKLILLDQILEIGDDTEIPLLEMLEDDTFPEVREKASKVKEQLIYNMDVEISQDRLLPMSLCFLYEGFNIRPANFVPDSNIDFEIAPDIYETD